MQAAAPAATAIGRLACRPGRLGKRLHFRFLQVPPCAAQAAQRHLLSSRWAVWLKQVGWVLEGSGVVLGDQQDRLLVLESLGTCNRAQAEV